MQKLQEDIADGLITFDDAVICLADADREHDLASLIGLRVAVDSRIILKALTVPSPEPAAAICRAGGLTLNGYSAVLRLRVRNRHSLVAEPSTLLTAYRSTTRATARQLADLLQEAGCWED